MPQIDIKPPGSFKTSAQARKVFNVQELRQITSTSLEAAVATGRVLRDVRRWLSPEPADTVTGSFHGVGRCGCGHRLHLHVVVRRGRKPALVSASVGGERCPDCEAALTPDSVEYLGIAGPGWPWVPATAFDPRGLEAQAPEDQDLPGPPSREAASPLD